MINRIEINKYYFGGDAFVSVFNPAKLHVTYLPCATEYKIVTGRKYTLTHSDSTGNLFLSVGFVYNSSAINMKNRDEVLAEWIPYMGQYVFWNGIYYGWGI